MLREKKLKTLISFLLALSFFIVSSSNSLAMNRNLHLDDKCSNYNLNNYYEEYTDDLGNIVSVEIKYIDNKDLTEIKVYLNHELTQISLITDDDIYYKSVKYSNFNNMNVDNKINSYDKVYHLPKKMFEEKSVDNILSKINNNYDGAAFYGHFVPLRSFPGTKPCDLYYYNYDEEPDLHRFNARAINITAGTPISVAIGLVIAFVTSELTPLGILEIIGASIAGDVVTNYVTNILTFSTKKIRYMPIIDGREIFGDAYIEELWLISHDNLKNIDTFHLAQNVHGANRGTSPEEIARDAQIAEAQGQY